MTTADSTKDIDSTDFAETSSEIMPVVNNLPAAATMPENNFTALIGQALSEGHDIATIERFIGLNREEEDRQAKRAFNAAMSELQSRMPTVNKTGRATFNGKNGGGVSYDYDKLVDIISSIKPLLFELGLSIRFETAQKDNGLIAVRCTISHTLGHSESSSLQSLPDNTGSKNSIQAIASTMEYLKRYTLKAILCIASASEDDGATSDQATANKVLSTEYKRWKALIKSDMNSCPDKQDLTRLCGESVLWAQKNEGTNTDFVVILNTHKNSIIQHKGW